MSRPLRTLRRETGAPDLLVLLPGAYMKPEDFVEAGFFSAVEQRGLKLDIAAVELDLDMISEGFAVADVLDQIVLPARQNHERVWLGGISLGGLLALSLHADRSGAVDGLCLIAPYPGSRLTTKPITSAGGIDAWIPSTEQLDDPEFRVYRWLKQVPGDLPAFVGYGREDRFADGMKTIAERFPAHARKAIPGGHEWPVWQLLWEHFLDLGHFAT
jgi:pimeloyl-ACP methyl ester carboxylesterase